MSIVNNMEVVFIAALALVGFTTFATADVTPAPNAAISVAAPASVDTSMATVVVSAKRLTADQKARLGS